MTDHFILRAMWIAQHYHGKRICIAGAGIGDTVKYLELMGEDVIGIDKYITNEYVVQVAAQDFSYNDIDVIFSWNLLDAITEEEVRPISIAMGTIPQYHVVCLDTDVDAQSYIQQGYLIKSREYWVSNFPYASIIQYRDEPILHEYPLSWGRYS